MSDTIFALSSAPGKAGVAVIRVSGPEAWRGLQYLTKTSFPEPRKAVTRMLYNPKSGQIIDNAMVLGFKGPASFTGEDVIEYHLHGSPTVLQECMDVLGSFENYRLANRGEFTRRAFENGKMDLTEAEAIADLIDAETQAQKDQALAQMGGALSGLYEEWRENLVKSVAYIEAVIDFPDEDIPDDQIKDVFPSIQNLITTITHHLDDNRRGERLRNGIHVAVIGAPNVGKSSLVNMLAQRDVAIVSDMAGTTRDIIDVALDLGGYPVILSDTAGLRPEQLGDSDQDVIESEGIRRALQRAREADIKLLVFDSTAQTIDKHTQNLMDEDSITVLNKSDMDAILDLEAIHVSTKTGDGLDELLSQLTDFIQKKLSVSRETPALTRQRHRQALEKCVQSLQSSLQASLPELIAEDARMAARHLGEITGRVDVEDLLDVIFKDFCIGK